MWCLKVPLNIERSTINEMKEAEASGRFDYDPKYDPSTSSAPLISFGAASTTIPAIVSNTINSNAAHSSEQPAAPPVIKRKNSLDDFELEIEGMNLDENIDTSVSFNVNRTHLTLLIVSASYF